MTRDLKQYLKHPDNLYRRFRYRSGTDKEGGAIYNKKWKQKYVDDDGNVRFRDVDLNSPQHKTGRGVYRSSYKNAMRLARTEINMAYHTSDYLRWQQMDFVVGIEVILSNNHTLNGKPFTDICDDLKGKYPKDFKFTGWHPQCRCIAVSILKEEDEIIADAEAIMDGEQPSAESVNTVTDVPDGFKQWITTNESRIAAAERRGTLPYFIRDNERYVQNSYYSAINAKITEGDLDYVTADEGYFGLTSNSAFTRIDATTSLSELEYTAGQILESKIKASMTNRSEAEDYMLFLSLDKNLDLDIAKIKLKRLYQLLDEYNIDGTLSTINLRKTNIEKGKTSKLLGSVETSQNYQKIFTTDSRFDNARFNGGASKCDLNKMAYSTDTHEFAHLMFTDKVKTPSGGYKVVKSEFYNEAEKVFKAYKDEIAQIDKERKLAAKNKDDKLFIELDKKYNNTYLGEYASKDVGEFIAEGFQEYKNCSLRPEPKPGEKPKPEELLENKYRTKYADIIGKLIDDNFRK